MPRYYNDFSDLHSPAVQHYGVQGMKWGIRRYVNYDGTLTPEGKRKYGSYDNFYKAYTQNKKGNTSTRQVELENKYKYGDQHMSQRAAQVKAIGQRQTERNLAIAAGVTLAAIGVGVGVKKYQDYTKNETIATGENAFKRMQWFNGKDHKQGGAIYGVYDDSKHDMDKYNGFYNRMKNAFGFDQVAGHRMNQALGQEAKDVDPYAMKITANGGKGVNMAGRRDMKRAFNDLRKNDPEFNKAWQEEVKNMRAKQARGEYVPQERNFFGIKKGIRGNYKDFVADINFGINKDGDMANKYYDSLRNRGFGAMHDINDEDRSGYKAKAAIFFDKNAVKWSATKLSDADIDAANERGKQAIQNGQLKDVLKYGSRWVGAGVAVKAAAGQTKSARAQRMYDAGASYKEIAKSLGIPENQVGGYISDFKASGKRPRSAKK